MINVLDLFATFTPARAGHVPPVAPQASPAEPMQATLVDIRPADPAQTVNLSGAWVSVDGATRLQLADGGRYEGADSQETCSGQFRVRGTRLYFVDDDGVLASGELVGGTLSIDGDQFRREEPGQGGALAA